MRHHPREEAFLQPQVAGGAPPLGEQRNTKRVKLREPTEPAGARHEKVGVRHDCHGIQDVPKVPVQVVALQSGFPLELLGSPLVGRPASLSYHMEVHRGARDLCQHPTDAWKQIQIVAVWCPAACGGVKSEPTQVAASDMHCHGEGASRMPDDA